MRAAAKKAGVSEHTLRRWLTDPAFVLALRDAETEALDATTRRLLGLQNQAVDTLQALLVDPAAKPPIRLRAAIASIELPLKLRELRDIEGRLLALEMAMQEPKP